MTLLDFLAELDLTVLYWIQDNLRTAFGDSVAAFLSVAFNGGILWFVLSGVLLIFRKTRTAGCMVLAAMGIAFLVGELGMKNIFCRVRPCTIDDSVILAINRPGSYSFPSGHTGSSFAAATALFLWNKKWGIPALVLAAVIGFSRLYLFVHFPTDVLVGAFLGILSALFVDFLFRKLRLDRRIQSIGIKK